MNRPISNPTWKRIAAAIAGCSLLIFMLAPSPLAAKPPSNEPAPRFDVKTLDGRMVIVGTLDYQNRTVIYGPAQGYATRTAVVLNRPSPAIRMDFLAEYCPAHFETGQIYSMDFLGTLAVEQPKKGGAKAVYFFKASPYGDGEFVHYRIDADAEIESDNGGGFPSGDIGGYTVTLTNLVLSVDTGEPSNGCKETSFTETVRLRFDRR